MWFCQWHWHICFFFWNSLQQHRNTPLHFIGEIYHLILILFLMRNIVMIVWFIGKCFTTWGWRKIWIIFSSLDNVFDDDLVECALVSLSDLGTFLIPFSISFPHYEPLYCLKPCTHFSTLEIFLIFMKFLIFEGDISCVEILVDPVWEGFKELICDEPDIYNFR